MASQFLDGVAMKFNFTVGSALTFTTTDIDIVNDTITIANHGFKTGDVFGILTSVGGTIPGGLTEATTGYYVILIDSNKFQVASSRAAAAAGTEVDITTVGVGTQTIYKNSAGIVQLGTLPDGFVVTNAWYNVVTTFQSEVTGPAAGSNDAGTIALSTGEGAGDLKAAISIATAGDVWDAGLHGCLPGSYAEATVAGDTAVLDAARKAGSYILLTADRIVTATIATETLIAGSLDLFIEGYQSR